MMLFEAGNFLDLLCGVADSIHRVAHRICGWFLQERKPPNIDFRDRMGALNPH
jgi:hypothetical protein